MLTGVVSASGVAGEEGEEGEEGSDSSLGLPCCPRERKEGGGTYQRM
jgi:hypothetical protein